jgi:hypothetical protein
MTVGALIAAVGMLVAPPVGTAGGGAGDAPPAAPKDLIERVGDRKEPMMGGAPGLRLLDVATWATPAEAPRSGG